MKNFTWPVSRSGYLWDTIWGLVTLATGEGVRTYCPMTDEPDLFIKFAELEESEEARLAFAARYGHLTRDVVIIYSQDIDGDWGDYCRTARKIDVDSSDSRYTLPTGPYRNSNFREQLVRPNGMNESTWFIIPLMPTPQGEPNHMWEYHTAEMKKAYADWKRLTEAKRAKPLSDACSHRFDLRDLQRRLESILSERLDFVFDLDTGFPSYGPTDLLSALWLQFAYAVSGAREYRPCALCSKLFGRSVLTRESGRPRRTREDKVYCTEKCRKDAAYVLRKAKRNSIAIKRSAEA